MSKLVDAKILKVTGSADPIVSLADQAYADPACAREVYEAYNYEEEKAEKKTETKAVIIPPVKRSMIEDIAFGMAEQGAEDRLKVKIKKLNPNAKMPNRSANILQDSTCTPLKNSTHRSMRSRPSAFRRASPLKFLRATSAWCTAAPALR